jgi:hypothetical protein
MKPTLFLLIILLIVGCHKESSSPIEQNNPKLGEAFDLKVGSSVSINGESLTFTFMNVPSDSRCPQGAVCKWAGNAMVVIKIYETLDTLNTMDSLSPAIYNPYKISLSKLSPYPRVGVAMDTTQYIGQFVITKI